MKLRKNAARIYTAYANIYDAYKGDRSENIARLEGLIHKHHPAATTALDLACGTGAIAAGLVGKYIVTGVDNSPVMLRIARAKLPNMQFVQADMTDFALSQKFDVVYCLHNSVNHLLTFDAWEQMFTQVARHLKKRGVFIFDVNPIARMNDLVPRGLGITQIGQDYVATQVFHDAKHPEQYQWDVKVFQHQKRDSYTLTHEAIPVSAFPLEQMEATLRKTFDIAESFVVETAEAFDDIGRAYYVCVKK